MVTFNNSNVDSILEKKFPNLGNNTSYLLNYSLCHPSITKGTGYNCVALAAGDYKRMWWPDPGGDNYWPDGVSRKEDLDSFISCFKSLGYEQCGLDDRLETGFDKVAIYVDEKNIPEHVAKQFSNNNGYWTSKLGAQTEFQHWLGGLSGIYPGMQYGNYGNVAMILKKQASVLLIL